MLDMEEMIAGYLRSLGCVLWGKSFDVITDVESAVHWLADTINGLNAYIDEQEAFWGLQAEENLNGPETEAV